MTTERGRPSLVLKRREKTCLRGKKRGEESPAKIPTKREKTDTCSLSAQTARVIVTCIEPRVVFCQTRLDYRHKLMLARNIFSFEYSCGSYFPYQSSES